MQSVGNAAVPAVEMHAGVERISHPLKFIVPTLHNAATSAVNQVINFDPTTRSKLPNGRTSYML